MVEPKADIPPEKIAALEDIMDQGQVSLMQLEFTSLKQIELWKEEMQRTLDRFGSMTDRYTFHKVVKCVQELERGIDRHAIALQTYEKSKKEPLDAAKLEDSESALQKREIALKTLIDRMLLGLE